MEFIKIGADKDLQFQAVNNNAVLDITTAEITFTAREINGTLALTKKNTAAGGDDSQIKTIDAENGLFVVYIQRNDTRLWESGPYNYHILITINSINYVLYGILHFTQKEYKVDRTVQYQVVGEGYLTSTVLQLTTAERDALTPSNGAIIYNLDINAFEFFENGIWIEKISIKK